MQTTSISIGKTAVAEKSITHFDLIQLTAIIAWILFG